MIVQLTEGQLAACKQVATGRLAEQLEHWQPEKSSSRRVHVNLPHIAWVACREALLDVVFTSKGYRAKGVPGRFSKAIQAVAAAINWWECLPAFRGFGMVGHQPFACPAWSTDHLGIERPWLPFPVLDRPMVLLRPVWEMVNGTKMTVWSPEDGLAPDGDWTTREDAFRGYEGVARRQLELTVPVDKVAW